MFPGQPYFDKRDSPSDFSLLSFLEVSRPILFWRFLAFSKNHEIQDARGANLTTLPTSRRGRPHVFSKDFLMFELPPS